MHFQAIVSGANALLTLGHIVVHRWAALRRCSLPPQPQRIPMSQTTQASAAATTSVTDPATFLGAVTSAGAGAMKFLATVGTDWSAIKQSDLFRLLKPAVVSAVTAELGAPAAGALVNLDRAVESQLDALAALHPAIQTP